MRQLNALEAQQTHISQLESEKEKALSDREAAIAEREKMRVKLAEAVAKEAKTRAEAATKMQTDEDAGE